MDFNRIFDVAFSESLSEELKQDLLVRISNSLDTELLEAVSESENSGVNECVDFVDLLTSSNITEEALDETLELAFGSLDEAIVEEITDQYRARMVREAIAEASINEYEGPVGLAGIRRQAEEKEAKQTKAVSKERPIGLASIKKQAELKDTKQEVKQPISGIKEKTKGFLGKVGSALGRLKDSAKKVLASKQKGYMKKDFKPSSQQEIAKKLVKSDVDANISKIKKAPKVKKEAPKVEQKVEKEPELVAVAPKRRGRPPKAKV